MLDGIVVIDKEKGYTSFDVVAKLRKILQEKKIGHTGTLDPLATGVLVIGIGKATKLVQYLTSDEKVYEVKMKLGIKTDTGDITGNVISQMPINSIENEIIEKVLKNFIGKQKQIPPMYSAIKKDGKKLYEYARKGIEIEREARDIEIFDIYNIKPNNDEINFTVYCSKGTYIRTLCEDVAKNLGTVGTMLELRRIKSGQFNIENAVKLGEISEENIISIEKLFDKKINIEENVEKLLNGIELDIELDDGLYNLYTNHYIGIGKIKNKKLKREIIL